MSQIQRSGKQAGKRRVAGRRAKQLNLALQGGGAHGAYTWGVIDRLLESGRVDLRGVTGTSAGAVNAVSLADGLARGGREEARTRLSEVWTDIGHSGPSEWLVSGSSEAPSLSATAKLATRLTTRMSPAQLNPFNLDPLGDVLSERIDFERLKAPDAPRISIAATHARTGRLRIFGNAEIQRDVILASACLPSIRPAVEIDGEPYWDGGYTANPPLLPVLDYPASDSLLVLICPTSFDSTPRTPAQIKARETEFAFTAGFLREVELLALATSRVGTGRFMHGPLERRLSRMRWHLIDAGETLSALDPQTRGIAYLPFLESLRDKGRAAADDWLRATMRHVGKGSTADLGSLTVV